jgi:hypothetical protein
LAGTANIQKQDSVPSDWIKTAFVSDEKRKTYLAENDLDDLPLDLTDFLKFYEGRKACVHERLVKALGATTSPASEGPNQRRDP